MPSQRTGKSNTYHPGKKTIETSRFTLMIRSVVIAAIVSVCVTARIFYVEFILHNEMTLQVAILKSILIFVVVFAFIAIALISGGKKNFGGESNISPWFAWFISGSGVAFWVGAFWFDNLYGGGFSGVGVWITAFICVWLVNRYSSRKKA